MLWVTDANGGKTAKLKSGDQPGSAEVGVVVIFGVAGGICGAVGATVSVMVSPVVISDVVTGPGDGGSAALVSYEAAPNAPMATTALAPSVAEASLLCFEFTSDHSIRSLGGRPASGRPIEQCRRSRPLTPPLFG